MFEITGWNWEGRQPKVQHLKQRNNIRFPKNEERWAEKGHTQIIARSYLTCLKTLTAGNGQPVGWYFINTKRFLQDMSHIALQESQEFIKY